MRIELSDEERYGIKDATWNIGTLSTVDATLEVVNRKLADRKMCADAGLEMLPDEFLTAVNALAEATCPACASRERAAVKEPAMSDRETPTKYDDILRACLDYVRVTELSDPHHDSLVCGWTAHVQYAARRAVPEDSMLLTDQELIALRKAGLNDLEARYIAAVQRAEALDAMVDAFDTALAHAELLHAQYVMHMEAKLRESEWWSKTKDRIITGEES